MVASYDGTLWYALRYNNTPHAEWFHPGLTCERSTAAMSPPTSPRCQIDGAADLSYQVSSTTSPNMRDTVVHIFVKSTFMHHIATAHCPTTKRSKAIHQAASLQNTIQNIYYGLLLLVIYSGCRKTDLSDVMTGSRSDARKALKGTAVGLPSVQTARKFRKMIPREALESNPGSRLFVILLNDDVVGGGSTHSFGGKWWD